MLTNKYQRYLAFGATLIFFFSMVIRKITLIGVIGRIGVAIRV
jgi:hypothetical protein